MLATASDDHTVKLWDLDTADVLQTLEHQFRVQACKFSPDGRVAITVDQEALRVWDGHNGQPLGVRIVETSFSGVGHALAKSSQQVATGPSGRFAVVYRSPETLAARIGFFAPWRD